MSINILRVLWNRTLLAPVTQLFAVQHPSWERIPKVTDLIIYLLKFYPNVLPAVFSYYYTTNVNIYHHNIDLNQKFNSQRFELAFGQRCNKAKDGTVWNAFPQYVKERISAALF